MIAPSNPCPEKYKNPGINGICAWTRSPVKPCLTSLILLAGSLTVTALLWVIGIPFFFLFLFAPLIPFFRRDRAVRRCPICGWETTGSENFCPRDASPLADLCGERGEGKD